MRERACEACVFATSDEPPCNPEPEELFERFGKLMPTAIGQCLVERVNESRYDDLTGLYTYKAFRENLEETFRHERASDIYVVTTPDGELRQRPGGFIFIDGEHTHDLDQELGHDALDEGLKGIARLLVATLRDGDLCCRRSGDEFIVFLPGEVMAVTAAADRLREAMQIGVPLTDGRRLTARLHLQYRGHIDSFDAAKAMINEADILLGQAKRRRDDGQDQA